MFVHDEVLSVKPDHEFEIRLSSTPSPYVWMVETCPDGLELLNADVVQHDGPVSVASPVVYIFRFHSTVPGQYLTRFAFKRQSERHPLRYYKIRVKVT